MAAWGKVALTVLLVLMPGGFLLALMYAFYRVARAAWVAAQARSPGKAVSLWQVVSQVDLRDVVRLARQS